MTPDEQTHFDRLRRRALAVLADFSDFVDTLGMTEAPLPEPKAPTAPLINQHFARGTKDGDDYWSRLKAVGYTPPCRCEFGWQPECPAHGDADHRIDPCSAPDHTPGNACPPADHQDEHPVTATWNNLLRDDSCETPGDPAATQDGKDRLYNTNPEEN